MARTHKRYKTAKNSTRKKQTNDVKRITIKKNHNPEEGEKEPEEGKPEDEKEPEDYDSEKYINMLRNSKELQTMAYDNPSAIKSFIASLAAAGPDASGCNAHVFGRPRAAPPGQAGCSSGSCAATSRSGR